MNKEVLISIRPEWCAKIISGEKCRISENFAVIRSEQLKLRTVIGNAETNCNDARIILHLNRHGNRFARIG